jgi:hypothetical protein
MAAVDVAKRLHKAEIEENVGFEIRRTVEGTDITNSY